MFCRTIQSRQRSDIIRSKTAHVKNMSAFLFAHYRQNISRHVQKSKNIYVKQISRRFIAHFLNRRQMRKSCVVHKYINSSKFFFRRIYRNFYVIFVFDIHRQRQKIFIFAKNFNQRFFIATCCRYKIIFFKQFFYQSLAESA